MDFDTRSIILRTEVDGHLEENVKEVLLNSKKDIRDSLVREYGEYAIEEKVGNFVAIDTKPFSTLAYHNQFFDQVRRAFVIGAYYPALVGACAMGERILNHLLLDLRGFYKQTPEYRRVFKKDSFDDWRVPINALETWGILLPKAVIEFRQLMSLRHRSIHFNASTYNSLRDDALSAILHMRTIIELQFGTFTDAPWFIPGTKGHCFIKKEYETHPFVKTYFLPKCPFVGPLFAMDFNVGGWRFFDMENYGAGSWTDEEFAKQYNDRDPEMVVKPTVI